jgi:hypothetical protein
LSSFSKDQCQCDSTTVGDAMSGDGAVMMMLESLIAFVDEVK